MLLANIADRHNSVANNAEIAEKKPRQHRLEKWTGERIASGTRNAVIISREDESGKKDKLVNRRDAPPQPGARKVTGKIITHAAMRSLAHATCTGRELLTNVQAVTVTCLAHLMRLRVHYASSHPTVPWGPGTIAFCGRGKAYLHTCGIIQFAMHRTYTSRDRAPARQRARLPYALRRIAVRRLMENALLPLNAVLRLPTIQSHLSTYSTARVEDLTRAFSRVRRFKRGVS